MASSNTSALIGGAAIVAVALCGAWGWRHSHPDAASPLAALAPMLPRQLVRPPQPVAMPVKPIAAAPASPAAIDRGPAPPSGADPDTSGAPAPTFDVVRVEPTGDAVVAGKGTPNAQMALVQSGRVVAEAKADANGQFVMIPPPLGPGAYDLSLRQQAQGQPAQTSKQAVAVAVPKPGKGQVVVALAEPGQPTKVLPEATAPPAAQSAPASGKPAEPSAKLAIRSVELENGTGFFATGTAPPDTKLQIYLNESHLADVTAGPDSQWSLRIGKGLTGGRYSVRADAIAPDARSLAGRVEVPFDVPVAPAPAPEAAGPAPPSAPNPAEIAAAAPVPPSAPPAAPPPARASPSASVAPPAPSAPVAVAAPPGEPAAAASNAVIADIETAHVVAGDNLWNISRARLGRGIRYTTIYKANVAQIRDPRLIYPGQVFVVPR